MPLNVDKIKTYVGFAIKSKQIIYGFDNIIKKKSYIIIISENLALNTESKIKKYAEEIKASLIKLDDMQITKLVNREGVKAFAISNMDLAKAIINNI